MVEAVTVRGNIRIVTNLDLGFPGSQLESLERKALPIVFSHGTLRQLV